MARFVEQFKLDRREPQTREQASTCDYLQQVFGWKAQSIHSLSPGNEGPCIVKVGAPRADSMEFICAGGLLVGIPPKGRWQK
jgi:hypothetical protein